jgi:hypothetical protein
MSEQAGDMSSHTRADCKRGAGFATLRGKIKCLDGALMIFDPPNEHQRAKRLIALTCKNYQESLSPLPFLYSKSKTKPAPSALIRGCARSGFEASAGNREATPLSII